MAEKTDNGAARVLSSDSVEASRKRERKKRKWDQPAEGLVSAGVGVPGVLPVSRVGSVTYPGIASVSAPLLPNSLVGITGIVHPVVQQLAHNTAVSKSKLQDELIIAREIVINDAESSVRYKLTKRQTQEEIQKCTGAVVITRGKYRPPNAPPDSEKPLYLHISAAAHLKETAERILAVDRAAAMVEEMMKQGSTTHPLLSTSQPPMSIGLKTLNTCVFLGFDPDPSLDIASRIRGPNDQYINHIMNETGATVLLKGHGSGNLEKQLSEEGQQPLHLLLSSNNPKSLEAAKHLAENLLDTISAEFGATRTSSIKVYGAVPPPQQLANVHNTGIGLKANIGPASAMKSSPVGILSAQPYSSVTVSHTATAFSQVTVSQSGGISNFGISKPNVVPYPQPLLTSGTSYSGYEGIYPQATPLQQVALALRQSSSPAISTVSPTTSAPSNAQKSTVCLSNEERRLPQKRKFQELPVSSKDPAIAFQGCGSLKSSDLTTDVGQRNTSNIPAPKKLVLLSSNGMHMPPPKSMPPPPPKFGKSMSPLPPPKFRESMSPPPPKSIPPVNVNEKVNSPKISIADSVPDTLVKLMEYGDEDDDLEENSKGSFNSNLREGATQKPFWAV